MRTQVDRTERQAVLLLGALRAAYLAIGSFASASLISILGAGLASTRCTSGSTSWRGWRWRSACSARRRWSAACVRLLAATRLSMLNMSEEAALIRTHEQRCRRPDRARAWRTPCTTGGAARAARKSPELLRAGYDKIVGAPEEI